MVADSVERNGEDMTQPLDESTVPNGQWCPRCRTTDHNEEAHLTVVSGQSDVDALPIACCETCVEVLNLTREIHAAFSGLANALGGMAQNPMMAAMSRQFGIDPSAIAGAMKAK